MHTASLSFFRAVLHMLVYDNVGLGWHQATRNWHGARRTTHWLTFHGLWWHHIWLKQPQDWFGNTIFSIVSLTFPGVSLLRILYQTNVCEEAYRRALAKMSVPPEDVEKYIAWVHDKNVLFVDRVLFMVELSRSIERSNCEMPRRSSMHLSCKNIRSVWCDTMWLQIARGGCECAPAR